MRPSFAGYCCDVRSAGRQGGFQVPLLRCAVMWFTSVLTVARSHTVAHGDEGLWSCQFPQLAVGILVGFSCGNAAVGRSALLSPLQLKTRFGDKITWI